MTKRLIVSLWVIGVLVFATAYITTGYTSAVDGGVRVSYAQQNATPTATISSAATPTPLDADLDAGSSRDIAFATDEAYQPEVENFIEFEEYPVELEFEEFFESFDMRRGWIMSDKLLSLDGQEVVMEGYVSPPLKARIDWIVLTKIALEFCPFCSSDADWPDDIALVYLPDDLTITSEYPIRVTGIIEVGSSRDAETGMVSLVRIYADEVEILD